MKNFRTYNIAVEFYHSTQTLKLPHHLKDQLDRASSSIVLNLAEGSGRYTAKDQRKFFSIALGSLRECQSILDLASDEEDKSQIIADSLGAHIYRLIQNVKGAA